MASSESIFKDFLRVKDIVIESYKFYYDNTGEKHLLINARPDKQHQHICPFCGTHCPCYDHSRHARLWRAPDYCGMFIEIEYTPCRVACPTHGIVTAAVPWAFYGSSFTKSFDMAAAWHATQQSKSAVTHLMRIDWQTVGRCISRSLAALNAKFSDRLNGLVNIGIDETSYRKGHKYITVIVNHDTNAVVWVANGCGKSVLEQFYNTLTPEQRASIKVVTGDGARWISDCVNKFTPNCVRCVDSFHVVSWSMEALDSVKRERWRILLEDVQRLTQKKTPLRGRPKSDDKLASDIKAAKTKADEIKNSGYTLGKAPEHLTAAQKIRLSMIQASDPKLYRAYTLKEMLRTLLKLKDVDAAQSALKQWSWKASHSHLPAFKELYKKIKRHSEHILNTIRFGMSNARIEATNNKIKLIIRKAYGFRNIQNMLDMVYIVCSDIQIPLPHKQPFLLNAA